MADEANGTTHSPIVLSRDALAVQMISVRTGTDDRPDRRTKRL